MNRISEIQEMERDNLAEQLKHKKGEILQMQEKVNQAIDELNGEIGAYNSIIEKVENLQKEVKAAIQGYIEEQDEEWNQLDEYETWYGTWDLSLFKVDEVNELELDEMDHDQEVLSMPESP